MARDAAADDRPDDRGPGEALSASDTVADAVLDRLETAPSPPEGAPGKRAPGRAGRNLPAAIGVGLGLAALVVVPLFSPYRWVFVLVLVAAAAVGTSEIVKALRTLGLRPPMVPLVLGGSAMIVAAYRGGSSALFSALVLTVLALRSRRG